MSYWKKIRGNHYLVQGLVVLGVIDCTGGTPPMARISILPECKDALVTEAQRDFNNLKESKEWVEAQVSAKREPTLSKGGA